MEKKKEKDTRSGGVIESPTTRHKYYAFTNFFLDACYTQWKTLPENIRYICWGEEICPETKREHLQCYIQFKRATKGKKLLKQLEVEGRFFVANGSYEDNYNYCSKEGKFHELGDPDKNTGQGNRTDLAKVVADLDKGATLKDIAKNHGTQFIKFHKGIEARIKILKEQVWDIDEFKFSYWQLQIIADVQLDKTPDRRKIHWYWESQGGVGKSEFSKLLCRDHGAICFDNMKKTDVIYTYKGERIVIFDLPRGYDKKDSYDILEILKKGTGFNTKYECEVKTWKVPHIFVFANWPPEWRRLSADRWNVIEIIYDKL